MTDREMLALAAVALPALTGLVVAVVPRRVVQPAAIAGLVLSGGVAISLALVALIHPADLEVTGWLVVDAAAGLMVGVIGLVGLASALVSPSYLETATPGLFGARHGTRWYYAALATFVAVLTAVPLAGNLGAAWLLVEATTAASAILVGFSGKPRALEAGWKYLLLTSLGLGFALLGIVLLASVAPGSSLASLSWRSLSADVPAGETTLVAFLLVHRRPRREDRLGAGPQLASGRPLRGPAPRIRAPLGRAPARRAARRLAGRAGARAGDRRAHRAIAC